MKEIDYQSDFLILSKRINRLEEELEKHQQDSNSINTFNDLVVILKKLLDIYLKLSN